MAVAGVLGRPVRVLVAAPGTAARHVGALAKAGADVRAVCPPEDVTAVATAMRPDVALVGASDDVAAVVAALREAAPGVRPLLLVDDVDDATIVRVVTSGCVGHVSTDASPHDLIVTIGAAIAGGSVLSDADASSVAMRLRDPALSGDDEERFRTELVRVLSDELLTPVTVLQGVVQTLASRRDVPQEMYDVFADSAQRAGRRLRRLVENVDLAAKIREEGLRPDPHPIAAARLVEWCARAFADQPLVRCPDPSALAGDHVDVDFGLAARALAAVVENALEHGPEGQPVDVRVGRRGGSLEFAVVDRGRGIPEELGPRAFELFVQGRTDDTRPHHGIGMGLYLVSEILRAHGGTVRIETTADGEHAVVVAFPATANADSR